MVYATTGTFHFPVGSINRDAMRLLYTTAVKSKLNTITIFIDEYQMYMTEVSYLNNMNIFYKMNLSTVLKAPEEEVQQETELTEEEFEYNEEEFDYNEEEFEYNEEDYTESYDDEDNTEDTSQSSMIRFSVHPKFLEALAQLKDEIVLAITPEQITVVSGTTILRYNNIRTMVDLYDNAEAFQDISWEKLKTDAVVKIATAMTRTQDAVAKRYIMLDGDKIFYNGQSFSVETTAWRMKKKYLIPYVMIEVIKSIKASKETEIGMKGKEVFIKTDEVILGLMLNDNELMNSALIDELPKSEYGFMFSLSNYKKQWGDIRLIVGQDLEKMDKATIETDEDKGIVFSQGGNMIMCAGERNVGFKVGVDLNLLHLGLTLTNSDIPKIYADCRGKLATLILVGDLTVAIRGESIEVELEKMKDVIRLEVEYHEVEDIQDIFSSDYEETKLDKEVPPLQINPIGGGLKPESIMEELDKQENDLSNLSTISKGIPLPPPITSHNIQWGNNIKPPTSNEEV